jgi:hypothetical protein
MTIVDIPRDQSLSRLNNLVIQPCDSQKFSKYFEFTKDEITTILKGDKPIRVDSEDI